MKQNTYNTLQNKHLLVTGGCGFIGSNFIHYAFAHISGVRITNTDKLTYAGDKKNVDGVPRERYRFVKGDIADISLMRRLMKDADYVINFAAETHVDRSIHGEVDAFIHTNVLGVHSLLKALQRSKSVKKMIHVSTDEVWGDLPIASRKKFDEHSPFLPNSPYAASKAMGDLLIRSYVKTYNLPVITTHAVNNFGPRQFPEKLIPFFTLRALRGERLPLYGDGKNVRNWLHVDDHAEAILLLLVRGVSGDVYAISGNEERSNIEVAHKILDVLRRDKNLITFIDDRPGHDRKYAINAAKLRKLGWRPRYSFEGAIANTVAWYIKNNGRNKRTTKRNIINKHIKL